MPAEWYIDENPYIKFRYRIEPKIPIAVYLQAFSTIEKERYVYIATTPAAKSEVGELLVGKVNLIQEL
jgi:hypothetical protein